MKVMSLPVSYLFNTYFLNPILIRLKDKDHLYPLDNTTVFVNGRLHNSPAFAKVFKCDQSSND